MKAKDHCQDVYIYLIGANQFQQELLVTSLKKIHGCRCTFITASSTSEAPEDIRNKLNRKKLIYLDCYDLSCDEITSLLSSVHQKTLPENLLALFNLSDDTGVERLALNYDVRGFFYSHDSAIDFCQGTRAILRGEVRLSRKMMSDVILSGTLTDPLLLSQKQPNSINLSPREKDVLSVLATGASNSAIGEALCISPHTVRTHLYRAYKKINVSNRFQAILWAAKNLLDT